MANIYLNACPELSSVPRTLDAAVEQLLAGLSDTEKSNLRSTTESDLEQFHFTWGVTVRQAFDLWRGNPMLLASCNSLHPDDASRVIIRAAWSRLQTLGARVALAAR